MSMTFADPAPAAPETSLQRRERLKKEGLRRGLVPSKAELAAQERERREEGLSRPLIPTDSPGSPGAAAAAAKKQSKGLAMMAKMGFTPGSKLGAAPEHARAEPLRIEVREDRGGLGLEGERKRKMAEAAEAAAAAGEGEGGGKRPRVDEGDYRERMARERDAARKEKLVCAAQRIAERMDEDRRGAGGGTTNEEEGEAEGGRGRGRGRPRVGGGEAKRPGPRTFPRPLGSVPVVYRGLVRQRESAERDRRMRHDMETGAGTLSARLPGYDEDDGGAMDADDRLAIGRLAGGGGPVYVTADDLDEEDDELEAFEALEVDERLGRLVGYLREGYRYCFWCKFAYPDEEMKGCPGPTEEDHD